MKTKIKQDFDEAIPLLAGLSLIVGPLMLFAAVSMIVETFKTNGQMVVDLINIANEGGFGLWVAGIFSGLLGLAWLVMFFISIYAIISK